MCRHILLAGLLVVLTTITQAADQDAKLTIRTLALRPLVEKEFWLKNGDKFDALAISDIQPSAVQQTKLISPLVVFRGRLDEHGKPAAVQPISVPLPAKAASVLLLAWPAGDDTRIMAIPDDFAKTPPNTWLLVNITRQPLAFQLGAESAPITIKPGTHLAHHITAAAGQGAAVKVAMPDDGKWKAIYSTYWPVDAKKRSLVLFVEDGRKIRVKLIHDETSKP